MPDVDPTRPNAPVHQDQASLLRHDLVMPINLIFGYCELLGGVDWPTRGCEAQAIIRSIRQHGHDLLRTIDQVLLADNPGRSVTDLRRLGQFLIHSTTLVVAACEDLGMVMASTPLPEEMADDLSKIKGAGQEMIRLARRLEAGEMATDGEELRPSRDEV